MQVIQSFESKFEAVEAIFGRDFKPSIRFMAFHIMNYNIDVDKCV
jgi:hypothetical protein